MKKIISVKTALKVLENIRKKNKIVVLTGGCFDILHVGHIRFLSKAKKQGDYLFLLLENDKTVKKLKGFNRPINSQKERAEVLAALSFVDYVVLLEEMKNNNDYDKLISALRPNIIATTKDDPQAIHNLRQAKEINAKVSFVTNRIKNRSTTLLAEIISKNFSK